MQVMRLLLVCAVFVMAAHGGLAMDSAATDETDDTHRVGATPSTSYAKVRVAVTYPGSETGPPAETPPDSTTPVVTIDEFPGEAIVSESIDVIAPPQPRVLATLYGTPITEEDVVRELMERRGRETFEWLVGRDIIQRELRRLGLEVDRREVEDGLRKHLAVLREAYPHLKKNDSLTRAASGMSVDEYRERTVWVELALRKIMRKTLDVRDEDLRTFFASVQAEFIRPERVRISQVFIAPHTGQSPDGIAGQDDWQRAEKQILEAHSRLKMGEDFSSVARTYGSGGQLSRWVKRGDLLRELEDAAFAIRPGSITTPIRSGMGYHILTVEEKQERNVPSFEEVRDEVRARFEEEQFVRLAGEFMARLREKALESGGLVMTDAP